MSSMPGHFTCITCRVQFHDGESQRLHYKSDWHRYNLKRKVAALPHVAEAAFQEKAEQQDTVKGQDSRVNEAREFTVQRCTVCSKNFASDNALQNHLESKKHKDVASKQQDKGRGVEGTGVVSFVRKPAAKSAPDATKSHVKTKDKIAALQAAKAKQEDDDDSDGWEDEDVDDDDEDVDDEVSAMDSDEEAAGWGDGDALPPASCLFCSADNDSVEANLSHMSAVHSFFVPDLEYLVDGEGLLTYLGEKVGCGFICLWCNDKGKAFNSVEAAQGHMRDKGHTMIRHEGDAVLEYADYYDYRTSYPDYDPSKTSESSMDVECESQDEELALEDLDGEGYQLVLPSGATIGHRSLLRYYKQSLNPRFRSAVVSKQRMAVQKLLSHYKALGWSGTTGEVAKAKHRDIQFAQKVAQKSHMRLGIKANKLQTYFRQQVMF